MQWSKKKINALIYSFDNYFLSKKYGSSPGLGPRKRQWEEGVYLNHMFVVKLGIDQVDKEMKWSWVAQDRALTDGQGLWQSRKKRLFVTGSSRGAV